MKKGKSEQYIKDEREFVKVMVKRAADGLIIRYGEGAAKLEGKDLARFMTVLDEYLGFFEKAAKRLRNEYITDRPGITTAYAIFNLQDGASTGCSRCCAQRAQPDTSAVPRDAATSIRSVSRRSAWLRASRTVTSGDGQDGLTVVT